MMIFFIVYNILKRHIAWNHVSPRDIYLLYSSSFAHTSIRSFYRFIRSKSRGYSASNQRYWWAKTVFVCWASSLRIITLCSQFVAPFHSSISSYIYSIVLLHPLTLTLIFLLQLYDYHSLVVVLYEITACAAKSNPWLRIFNDRSHLSQPSYIFIHVYIPSIWDNKSKYIEDFCSYKKVCEINKINKEIYMKRKK